MVNGRSRRSSLTFWHSQKVFQIATVFYNSWSGRDFFWPSYFLQLRTLKSNISTSIGTFLILYLPGSSDSLSHRPGLPDNLIPLKKKGKYIHYSHDLLSSLVSPYLHSHQFTGADTLLVISPYLYYHYTTDESLSLVALYKWSVIKSKGNQKAIYNCLTGKTHD